MKFVLNAAAAIAALLICEASASAAFCGQWFMGNGGRDLVIGVASDGSGNALSSGGHPYLALCERTGGGSLTYQDYPTGCTDTSEGAGDFIMIYGGTGDDRIGPLQSAAGEISCGLGHHIMPFSSWRVPMWAYGNYGTDLIYGTDGADGLTSSDTNFTADSSNDVLCGFGGNDLLVGDYDSESATSHHECIDGGAGTNTCDGVASSSPYTDAYVTSTCSTAAHLTTTSSCGCTAAAANFW